MDKGEVYFDGEVYTAFTNCPECGEDISADLSALSSEAQVECSSCGRGLSVYIAPVALVVSKPCLLTDKQQRALSIILSFDGITPSQFAAKMWPDSEGHKVYHNVGRGVSRGAGMSLAGGGHLGRLRKKGLVRSSRTRSNASLYYVTLTGREFLEDCGGAVDF